MDYPPPAEVDILSPARFAKELWGLAPKEWLVEFDLLQYRPTQANPDDKRMRAIFYTVEKVTTAWDQIAPVLDKYNRTQIENVHPSVNPRFQKPRKHGKNTDVSHYVALWVDVDFDGNETGIRKQFNETLEDLKKAGLYPSCIVESGRGLHAYWLLDMPYLVKDARPFCAGIQDYFKISDPVHDPRRVLRMPGFLNLKNPKDPKWCKIVEATWKRYSLLDFKDYSVEPSKSPEDIEDEELEKSKPKTVSRDPKIEEIKKGVSQGTGPYGGRHLAAVALAGHYCGNKKLKGKKYILYAMLDWNKSNQPPLPDEEIEQIVDDIWSKEQVKRAEEPSAHDVKTEEKERRRAQLPWFDEEGAFNPSIMAQHFIQEYKMISTPIGRDGRGVDLYLYKNGVYIQEGNAFIRKETDRLLGPANREKYMEEVLKLVTERVKIGYHETNKQACELINVKNGLLDWKTGELKPHDPSLNSLIQINTEYDANATSSDLDRFMSEVLPEDTVASVEEFLGYLLIPDTSFGKCLVAVGEGGNGKSTVLKLVEHLIGTDNISNFSLHSISEDRFTAAGLFGKLANFYDELESKVLENTATFKQLVTGEAIKAEEKNKAPFSFKPFARLIFATNQMPRANDRSQAYFDRLLFIRFPNRFRGTKKMIRNYDVILAKTPGLLSALLNRAVVGLRRLMDQVGFSPSATSLEAIEDYQRECNSAYDFLKEHCSMDPNGWISRSELYDRYRAWCGDTGRKPMSQREFTKTLKTSNVREVRHGDGRGWGGISWSNGRPPVTSKSEVEEFGGRERREERGQGHLDF